jgi:hemin uptake protein HemP
MSLATPNNTQLPNSLPIYDAEALTAGGHQAQITLHDKVYSLRITRAGKLILTK